LRKYAVFAIAAVVTGLVAGVVIAGSGDDGSSSKPAPAPELKPPPGSIGSSPSDRTGSDEKSGTTGSTGTTGPAPAPAEPAPSGGAQPPAEDSPQNDTQPPSGSPAQKFEDFCNQNPGAC
jgi:hypothetical protein